MHPDERADDYERLVRRARARLAHLEPAASRPGEAAPDLEGPDGPVQLSVRLSPRLRAAVAGAARRRGTSVTAFVVEALEEAVRAEQDPFAGLAADLVADLQAELAQALETGAYRSEPAGPVT